MAKPIRLGKAAGELNVGVSTIFEFLEQKGVKIDVNPNTKLTTEQYELLRTEFAADQTLKEQAHMTPVIHEKRETISLRDNEPEPARGNAVKQTPEPEVRGEKEDASVPKSKESIVKVQVVGKIDLDKINQKTRPDKKPKTKTQETGKATEPQSEEKPTQKESTKEVASPEKAKGPVDETIRVERKKLTGPNVVGKIELPIERPKTPKSRDGEKRKRIGEHPE